ncbi:MAG: YkgJ family cysteine cluster protein [Crenarchaeota archaeon]|nr:YkgJ family cysteine cluster protein [Thermoproteota archaeon]
MLSKVFTCARCGKCCKASLFIPLSYEDFYDWYLSKCFLPILFSIRESNIYTEEAGIEWAYTLLSTRHSIYSIVRNIFERHSVKLSDEGCSMFNMKYNCCRIYSRRPLVCRLFPFDSNLRTVSWALENCEAVKNGFVKPPPDYVDIARRYSRSIEKTYSEHTIIEKIERIRRVVFERVLVKVISDRYEIETLRYLFFKIVEYG